MMKQRPSKRYSLCRGLPMLFAVSCFVPALGCAVEAMEDDGLVADGAVEENGDEGAPDQGAPAETDEGVVDQGSTAENGEVEGGAVCTAYGEHCASDADCCDGMSCHFDGYISYCRQE